MESVKLFLPFTRKRKLGYALGIFTDSLLYNMFYTYFLTFLVQIVGIKPAVSGAIIFVSICWDAITDPLIGAYTDRDGIDKRRVMKRAIIPLALVFMLSWLNWRSILKVTNPVILVAVYIVLTMAVWLFYTLYTIPYYAVVAEITEDYDERTAIRSQSSIMNAVAIALGNALPALVTIVVFNHVVTYFDVSVLMAVLAAGAGFICVASLKGLFLAKAEKPYVKANYQSPIKTTLKGFKEIIALKPFKYFMVFVFFFLFASSMIQSAFAYTVVYCIGFEYDTGIILIVVGLVLTMAVIAPLSEFIAKKLDRKAACLILISLSVLGLFGLKIMGMDRAVGSFRVAIVALPIIAATGMGAFWTLFYSMAYDFVEIDEFKNGERRESLITAFPQFVQKMGSAAGIFSQGILLTAYGYVKGEGDYSSVFQPLSDMKIINGMENITTIFPAILLCLALIGLVLLPTTRKRMDLLTEKLEKKRNGEEVTSEGLEKLV